MSISKRIDALEEEIKRLNKVDDKLEQRISTLEKDFVKLEKVSGSHAKCIGEIREKESKISNFILP